MTFKASMSSCIYPIHSVCHFLKVDLSIFLHFFKRQMLTATESNILTQRPYLSPHMSKRPRKPHHTHLLSSPRRDTHQKRCCAVTNISEEQCLTSATQTRRPQRVNPLPIHNSARMLRCLLLESPQQPVIFSGPSLSSVSLQHPVPWRIHTWRIRRGGEGARERDSTSASAAVRQRLTRVGDGRREEREPDG